MEDVGSLISFTCIERDSYNALLELSLLGSRPDGPYPGRKWQKSRLVKRSVSTILPILRIARRVKAAEHDGIVGIKIVEQGVREPGHERPSGNAVARRLPFRIPLDQVENSRHSIHESIGRLHTALPVPTARIGEISLGLRGEPGVHSCASMRPRTSAQELRGGGVTAY